MATKESVHRRLLVQAAFWREKATDYADHYLPHLGDLFAGKASAFEHAAEMVSEIDSFEQEGPE